MAICAVCLRSIEKPQRILLVNSEVIHKACAGGTTLGQKTAQAIADAHVALAKSARLLEQRNLELQASEQRRYTAEDLLRLAQEAIRGHEVAAARRDAQLAAARNALATANRELEELRKKPEPAASGSSEEQPAADDAETRFSLLELDPL